MMDLERTKANARADLSFQSADHGWRVAFSVILFCAGVGDIVCQRFVFGGPWPWEGSLMALVGVGVLFTKTFTDIIREVARVLPFTRNGR